LPGVGRKTASLVLGDAFGKPNLAVDTHFARLARRFGWTAQTDPDKIEHEVAAPAGMDRSLGQAALDVRLAHLVIGLHGFPGSGLIVAIAPPGIALADVDDLDDHRVDVLILLV
jgi:hypothetical protein